MCYDIKSQLISQLKRARNEHDEEGIRDLEDRLRHQYDLDIHHASGFSHPTVLIYTHEHPYVPTPAVWGLIPPWIKDTTQKLKFWNNTLNARGETIFEKPSFRLAAKNTRCLIMVDGFYEHHHYKGKKYPFYISREDSEPLTLGGLWSTWLDKETGELINSFTIVTTNGNELMAKIHNNPKLNGPRMPLILPDESADVWLQPINHEGDISAIKELIQPLQSKTLKAYTVAGLRGKNAIGNILSVTTPFNYIELPSPL